MLEKIGNSTLNFLNIYYEALYFTYECILKIFNKKSYNSATKDILIKQIYFTSVQLLPLLIFVGVVFGVIIIATIVTLALDYGLKDHIGSLIVNIVIIEFAPLATVLLIALRSSAAISTEISVMKSSNELNTLKAFNINLIEYLFLPRIIAGIISLILLASMISLIMILSGYIYLLLFLETGLDLYIRTLIHALTIDSFIIFFIKTFLFGFFVILIPIYSAIESKGSISGIPIAVLNAMVKVILAIMSIEVISLIIQYL